MKPVRISTLLDYTTLFGGAEPAVFEVAIVDGSISNVAMASNGLPKHLQQHSINHFFKNGGGACYIVSIGGYDTIIPTGYANETALFSAALDEVAKEDEPTLIVLADALRLGTDDYVATVQQALVQCNTLQDRFVIVDMDDSLNQADFRNKMASSYLKYGAAYTPFLETTLTHTFDESAVIVTGNLDVPVAQAEYDGTELKINFSGFEAKRLWIRINQTEYQQGGGLEFVFAEYENDIELKICGVGTDGLAASAILTEWELPAYDWIRTKGWELAVKSGQAAVKVTSTSNRVAMVVSTSPSVSLTLNQLEVQQNGVYNQVKAALGRERVTLPASPAIAGVYASVDRDRGVWKAPANVPLSAVIGPSKKISNQDQESLNVDTSGKSINAIRAFAGKGTLVWGARTLAGNDNEWRYVSVRRLFNLIEESTRKATAFAVFEPNNSTTWLKVKAMIDTYLYGLWERGALVGNAASDAFFVNIGLGKTMTPDDILN
ncbi:MAG TPA: phage tail sheath family protein, partial [Bacteroidetes bacterium]|nr:phage tail sheath family protein [Bacteroidota bacterium]